MMFAQAPAAAQDYSCAPSVSVLTSQYNTQRTGANTQETCLKPSNVPNLQAQIQFLVPTDPGHCGSSCCPSSDNPVYTQPLYVYQATVNVHGTPTQENVVIVTTLNDQVFVFDAANNTQSNPCSSSPAGSSGILYWTKNLINNSGDCGGYGLGGTIPGVGTALPYAGIVSTPVVYVNGQTETIYVVGGCEDGSGNEHWYLHGLNLLDGSDAFTPIDVGYSTYVPSSGNAAGAASGTLQFEAAYQLQRSALSLAPNGELFIPFGVGGGSGASEFSWTYPYHGWLLGYNVIPTPQSAPNFAFSSTPNGPNVSPANTTTLCTNSSNNDYSDCGKNAGGGDPTLCGNICGLGGGIWMSGKAPALYTSGDTTYVFAGVGNGGVLAGGSTPLSSWGSSVVAFDASRTCNTSSSTNASNACYPAQFYTPSNYQTMNAFDQDMGTSGPVITDTLTSGQNQLVTFDKSGTGYVMSPLSLPGYTNLDCGTNCKFEGSLTASIIPGVDVCGNGDTPCDSIGSAVYWNAYLFVWPQLEDVDWCPWEGALFSCTPVQGSVPNDEVSPSGFPGGMLSLSANCTNCDISSADAVLWAIADPTHAKAYVEPDTDSTDFHAELKAYGLKSLPTTGDFVQLFTTSTSTTPFLGSIFAPPTVANGMVYVPTYDSGVLVFYPSAQ